MNDPVMTSRAKVNLTSTGAQQTADPSPYSRCTSNALVIFLGNVLWVQEDGDVTDEVCDGLIVSKVGDRNNRSQSRQHPYLYITLIKCVLPHSVGAVRTTIHRVLYIAAISRRGVLRPTSACLYVRCKQGPWTDWTYTPSESPLGWR